MKMKTYRPAMFGHVIDALPGLTDPLPHNELAIGIDGVAPTATENDAALLETVTEAMRV